MTERGTGLFASSPDALRACSHLPWWCSVCDSVVGYGPVEFACQYVEGHDGPHIFREEQFTVMWGGDDD